MKGYMLKWLKWKIKIRWRNTWNYFSFLNLKLNGQIFFLLSILKDLTTMMVNLGIFYFLFYYFLNNPVNTNSDLNFINLTIKLISSLFGSQFSILILIIIITVLYAIQIGIVSSKRFNYSKDKEWMVSHLNLTQKETIILLFTEEMIWRLRDLSIIIIPILIAFILNTTTNALFILGLILSITFLYISLIIIVATIHNYYLKQQSGKQNFYLRLITSVIFKTSLFVLGIIIANILTPWINNFPQLSLEKKTGRLELWVKEGFTTIQEPMKPMFYNIISMIQENYYFVPLFSFVLFVIAIVIVILIYKRDIHYTTHAESTYLSSVERLYTSMFTNKKLKTLIKVFFRSKYTHNVFPILFGSMMFWLELGIFSGILRNLKNYESEISIFIISFCLYFLTFHFINPILDKLVGILSLESDGKLIVTYFLAGKTLWDVMKQKLMLIFILLIPIYVFYQIVFFFVSHIPIHLTIFIIFTNMIISILYVIILQVPSVVSPHFNYLNIEDIDDYPEKMQIKGLIVSGVSVLFNPILMIPSAFFMVNKFTYNQYILYQYIIVNTIIITIIIIILLLIKKRLQKISSTENLDV
ncbi:hypothetical protein [Bacillus cereus]|uniref:hypothetical protein n=1 Tax=Bacillus cereus TaxID=1396 RepID=UPI001D0EE4FC|nr:hypothetical protein [Bacillus cereus]MCC2363994.1 hypothetical protein [Bacillus cereus]